MAVIYFLIGVGVLVAGGFLAAFIWSVRSGQYDDDYTPSVRMLFDNYKAEDNNSSDNTSEEKEKMKEKEERSNNNKS